MPTQSTKEYRAPLAAAAGSICVGTVPSVAMGLYADGFDPQSLLFWRYWLALAVLVPLAALSGARLADEWRRAGHALFLNSVSLGVVQTFTYFRAIQTLPSSVAVTIFFMYPVVTVVLDRLVYGRRAKPITLMAIGLIILGVLLAGWPQLRLDTADPIGLGSAILTPLIFGIYIAIAYRFTRETSPSAGATFIYLGLACGFAIATLMFGLKVPAHWDGWWRLIVIAVVGGVLQISAFAYALPRLAATGYSIVVSLELVTVALLGVAILGEQLALLQVCGIVLVIVGIIIERLLRRS